MQPSAHAVPGSNLIEQEAFDWEKRVEKAQAAVQLENAQLPLAGLASPDLPDMDTAKTQMRVAIATAQKYGRGKGRPPGSPNVHTARVRDDLLTAWTMLGGYQWILACLASGDAEMRSWALRMFEKLIQNSQLMVGSQTQAPDGSVVNQFVMVTTASDDGNITDV